MKNQHLTITLLIIIIIILIMGYLNLNIKNEYQASKRSYLLFEESAKKIYSIKRMKKNKISVISQLKRIQTPKIREKTQSTIYTFENLNQNLLNSLLRKIKGSYIPIKHLKIDRDATNHATIILEVAK